MEKWKNGKMEKWKNGKMEKVELIDGVVITRND